MYYYEVWVGSLKFHAGTALTYSSSAKLKIGEVISVPLRNQNVMAFVSKQVSPSPELIAKLKPIVAMSGVALPLTSQSLHLWMQEYYPAPSGTITNLFLPPSLPKDKDRAEATAKKPEALKNTKPLTADQSRALKEINSSRSNTVLLHGDTGTGKTRIYLELAKEVVKKGKSAIVLTPEIGLTPQMVRDFSEVFPNKTVVLHSNLTPAKRRDNWYKVACSTEPLIVIGPRSALFAPLSRVGLIVIDEAHEHTYKQEQAPYYQATRVAPQLARLHEAKCVFGTATPSVSDYYVFQQKKMPVVRIQQLATGDVTPPKISLVSLRNPEETRKSRVISKTLASEILKHTEQGQQALLFLNRRGSARMVLCQNCGWQADCPNCDIALTYHADQHKLLCHTCGFNKPIVTSCPECHSNDIIYNTPGTKSLEQEAKNLFPTLRIRRFDSDNLADEKLERHFKSLVEGGVDIIIGTQLVTKGLDLPQLGVVGIINADSSLNFPDYTAEETTYQQLSQVIGRVGRHQKPSSVVIQTYNPDNPLLKLVTTKDWRSFLQQQLTARQQFGFPPFYFMLQLRVARASRSSAQQASQQLVDTIRANTKGVLVRGPSPQLHEKVRDKYHWQVIVSSKERQVLLEIISNIPSGWQYNIDPINLM